MEIKTPPTDLRRRGSRPLLRGLVAIIAMVSTLVVTSGTASALPAPSNQYVAATVSGGVPSPATPLAPGDCALLVQMTGTIASGLGQFEILDPATAAPTLVYSDTEATQYVVLPGGCSQVIDLDTTYSPPAWNPASGTGGVVFLGGTVLNLAADIDVSEAGFASGHSVGAGCDGGDGAWGPDGSMWDGGAGGGGIIGGGGGAGAHVGLLFGWNTNEEFDSAPGGGGSATAGGAGGAIGDAMGFAPDGGDAGCVGSGGSPDLNVVAGAFYTTGAGAGGGGSYGGGGGACSSRSSGAYSGGGGGGGSYAGGGAGGWEGTNTGYVDPGQPGEAGNPPLAAEITAADHFFHDADPRVMMGGAGGASFRGDGSGPNDGGRGGGIVVLAFDAVVGAGGSVLANGGDGSTPPNFSGEGSHGSSGSGGGAGGQIVVTSPDVSDAFFSTTGGLGGFAIEDTSSNGNPHTGSTGASGGGGGVWFAGVGPETSNTGANNGATSADANVVAPGLTNVDWIVAGGTPLFDTFPAAVTVGATTYPRPEWAAVVAAANADSQVTFKPIATSLVDASAGDFTLAELVARFPWLAQPDNPKNLGLGCGPGLGGTGLVMTSIAPVEIGNYVWLDANLDGIQDAAEEPLADVAVTLFADDGTTVLGSTTTDVDGLYTFSIAPETDFVISMDPSAASAPITAINPAILLVTTADAGADDTVDSDIAIQPDGTLTLEGTSGEPEVNISTFDAGFVEPDHRIGNLVWLDSDDSGTADVGEPGIAGLDVNLFAESGDAAGFDAGDQFLATTTTDAEGNYWFDVLAGATYYVAIPEAQTGTPQVNTTGGLQPVDSAALASSTGISAADSDVDNTDDGEPAAGYLTMSGPIAIDDDAEPTLEADTNVDPALDSEAYVEAQPDAADHDDVDSNLTVDLGFVPLPRIGGLLWVDSDFGEAGYNDGVADSAESTTPIGLASVELWEDTDGDGLFDPLTDTLVDTTTTDASGNYYFDAVQLADYFVAVPTVAGYVPSGTTSDADLGIDDVNNGAAAPGYASLSDVFTVALADNPTDEAGDFADPTVDAAEADANTALAAFTTDDNSDLTIDFGFVKIPTYEIGNLVWNDLNNDGLAEASEPGIAGVLVELWEDTTGDGAADTLVTSVSTDADGNYNFAELPAGDYIVVIPDDQSTATNPTALDGQLPSSNDVEADPDVDLDNTTNGASIVDLSASAGPAGNASGVLTVGEGADFADEPVDEHVRTDDVTADESPTGEVDDRSNLTVDFGYYSLRIGNQVWQDSGAGLNEDNGVFDADEPGITGVTVELWEDTDASGDLDPSTDTLIETTLTDAEGNYWFDGITADTDYIVAVPEATNTGDGEPLFGQRSSIGQTAAAGIADNLDDGAPDATIGYLSVATPVAVVAGAAPTGEIDSVPAGDDAEAEANTAGAEIADSNSDLHVDFGFAGIPTYEIGNLVWSDLNNDGLAEASEPGITGVLVELWEDTTGDGVADTLVNSISTDADGTYNFAGLLEGDYIVVIPDDQSTATNPTALDGQLPSSNVEPDPNTNVDNDANGIAAGPAAPDGLTSGIVELGDGTDFSDEPSNEQVRTDDVSNDESPTGLRDDRSNLSVDFGFYQMSIGSQLWNDADNNGQIDAGEALFEGAVVELWEDTTSDGVADTLVESTTTDPTGLYLFDELPEGDYVVVIPASEFAEGALLDGFRSSDPTETDPNSDVDGNDNGIANTDGSVSSGIVELRAGDEPTGETPDNDPTTPDANENLTIDFGFYELSLGDLVFADIGAGPNEDNAVFDADESGIEYVQVELWVDTDDSGDLDPTVDELVDTTVTDELGNYGFDFLQDDETYLVAIPEAGNAALGEPLEASGSSTLTSADPSAADNEDDGAPAEDYRAVSGPVTVDAGNEALPDANADLFVDFGFVTPPVFEIGNLVWADDNNNGIVDDAELGIEGVDVELWRDTDADGVGDVLVDTETTDVAGNYLFDMVFPGDYTVIIPTAPDNLVSSTLSEADPNVDIDNTDNGLDNSTTDGADGVSSGILTVGEGADIADEPIDETDESPTGLRDDRSNLTVDFGFYGLSLGNQVWHDLNNDGIIDADEPLLAGVTINLWEDTTGDGVPDTLVDTTVTAADGLYLFEGLSEGAYVVEVPATDFAADAPLDGLTASDGLVLEPSNNVDNLTNGEVQDDGSVQTGVIELAAGAAPTAEDPSNDSNPVDANSNLTVDLGFYGLALGNNVFFDTDVDGEQDADEPGAAGVDIDLWVDVDSDGTPDELVDSTVTDADGNYLFTGLSDGDYIVELPASNFDDGAALDGWVSTDGAAEEADPNNDVDGNDNGIDPATPGEAVQSGVVILSALGEPDGSTNLTVDFGFYNLSLGNQIWEDVNNNGLVDADENGIANVVVDLFTDADGDGQPDDVDGDGVPDPVQTVTTDADGFYDFDGLLPGTYVVGVSAENFVDGAPLSNMTSSTPTTADPEDDQDSDDNGIDPDELGDPIYSLPIVLAANAEPTSDEPPTAGLAGLDDDSNLTIDFGFFVIPIAGGAVWDDVDEDGVFDADEEGIADIDAALRDSDGNVVSSVTTDEEGIYAFDVVEPGIYTIEFDPDSIPQGYGQAIVTCPDCLESVITTSVLGVSLTSPPFEIAGGGATPTVGLAFLPVGDGTVPAALAFTGSTITSILMLAFILLAAGSTLAIAGRRRRNDLI